MKYLFTFYLLFIVSLSGYTQKRWVGVLPGTEDGSMIETMYVEPFSNILYVGGTFSNIGYKNIQGIAKYDGQTWSSLGSGVSVNTEVRSIISKGSKVYAGGTANGTAFVGVYDTVSSTWSSFGPTMNGLVTSLAFYNNELYAGGYFFDSLSQYAVASLLKWDGNTWHIVLGEAELQTHGINSMVVYEDELYVGGIFLNEENNLQYIARWDGSQLKPFPSYMVFGFVYNLYTHNDNLYVGGDIWGIGDDTTYIDAASIAKWNGDSWSTVGNGVSFMGSYGTVYTITAGSDSLLYCGGMFDHAGGSWDSTTQTIIGGISIENNMASWNGANWNVVGTSLLPENQPIYSLIEYKGELYAGGQLFLPGEYFLTKYTTESNCLTINKAYINISGGTNSNKVYLVINDSVTTAIQRLVSGHIYTQGQYDFVKWNAGGKTGEYVFPFGVGGTAADYIPLIANKTSGTSSDITASTWYTNQQNIPHPGASNVVACHKMTGPGDSVTTALDRFWDIRSSGPLTADLTFSYRASENTTASPSSPLNAQRWQGTTSTCGAWSIPLGDSNSEGVTSGIGTVGPVKNLTAFSPFALINVSIPITPGLTADAGDSKSIPIGMGTTIGGDPSASNGIPPYSYLWTPSTALSSTTVPNPIASPLASTTYLLTVTDQQGCIATDDININLGTSFTYATPRKNLDGGYYSVKDGFLFFKHTEEYASTTLQYAIYDQDRNIVSSPSLSSNVKIMGDNRYVLDCRNITGPAYYILEIKNEKNEITKLRFKIELLK